MKIWQLHVQYKRTKNAVKTNSCWKVFLLCRDHVIFEIKLRRNHTWDVSDMTYAYLKTYDLELNPRTQLA